MKNKRVLVTGGNGFIGSKIVERLVGLGNNPYLILREKSNKVRLASHLSDLNIFESDLTNRKKITSIVEKIKPEIIFHLASHGIYSYTINEINNIQEMIDVNVQGTINLMYATKDMGYSVFINTGTCFEYGNSNFAFKEDFIPHPENFYGATKVAATLFAENFYKQYKLPIVTLRPFTVYGPGEDGRRFISATIKSCFRGESPKLASQRIIRDYIYIDDVVDAYILAAAKNRKLAGEVINISTGIPSAIQDVAKLIIKHTKAKNLKPDIGGFSLRTGEALSLVGSAQKAKALLDWEAKYSLQEGLLRTIAWIKSQPVNFC